MIYEWPRATIAARTPRVLVLGAGICGLAAALELVERGARVLLVESERETGGLLRTSERDGFRFDRGGHRFITAIPWVLARIEALLGDRLLLRERKSFVLLDGTRIAYPLAIGDLLQKLGPLANLRALASYLSARARGSFGDADDTTLADWLRRRFGDYLYQRVFAGYTRKLWGLPPEQMSAEWAPQRFSIPTLGGFLRHALFASARPPRTIAVRFLYPRLGIGEIAEHYTNEFVRRGGELRLATHVTTLAPASRGFRAQLNDGDQTASVEVDGVISTVPLAALRDTLTPKPAPQTADLPMRGLRFLNLAFQDPIALDATWLYQPDPRTFFTRLQVPAARSPELTPSGRGSLQLEIPWDGVSAPPPLADEVALARTELRRAGIETSAPLFAFRVNEPSAYPIYRNGARSQARTALAELGEIPHFISVGRQGQFSYIFLDRALADGVNAARRMLGLVIESIDEDRGARAPLEAASLLEERIGADS
ncbi:MAG: FAD-dependent oxidoreductase [Planctomycetota bacterium]